MISHEFSRGMQQSAREADIDNELQEMLQPPTTEQSSEVSSNVIPFVPKDSPEAPAKPAAHTANPELHEEEDIKHLKLSRKYENDRTLRRASGQFILNRLRNQ